MAFRVAEVWVIDDAGSSRPSGAPRHRRLERFSLPSLVPPALVAEILKW